MRLPKTLIVLQNERTDCGPAAILSVLRYHGGELPLPRLRELSGTGSDGSSLAGIAEAAQAVGLQASGARGDYISLQEVALPCIAHVVLDDGQAHFVVVYEARPDGVLIMDPAQGFRSLTRSRFEEMWRDGTVLLLEPGEEIAKSRPEPWTGWLWAYVRLEHTWLVQSAFLGAAYTALGLLTALFVQATVDRFIPRRELDLLLLTGLLLLGIQGIRAGVNLLRQRFLIGLRERVSVGMIDDFFAHLFRLPVAFFDRRKAGDIAARVDDAVVVQNAVFLLAGGAVVDLLVVPASIGAAFLFAPPLAWIAVAAVPVYGGLVAWTTRSVRSQQREVLQSYGALQASSLDGILGAREVRSFNAATLFARLNSAYHRTFQGRLAHFATTQARIGVLAELAANAVVVCVLLSGAVLVLADQIALGAMLAVYALLAAMLPSVGRLAEMHIALRQASAAAQRLFDILHAEAEVVHEGRPLVLRRSVTLRDVHFGWPGAPPILQGASIDVHRGELVGLWGRNGSGKSTLVRILDRSYSVTAGSLLLDGQPAEAVELESWRRNVVVVPEDAKLLHGTIADNILLGRSGAELPRLIERLREVGLEGHLHRFPHGLGTLVGEAGRRLSSGERQFVGLMRALLDEPAVLLIDEGTNALDSETALAVGELLRRYAADHAILMVSHDVRTLEQCDRIFVLSGGQIRPGAPPRSEPPHLELASVAAETLTPGLHP